MSTDAQGKRARRRGLTPERVVAGAIELADAEGIEAVSMARLAEQLGFSTMALYRHVSGKDDLVAQMVDHGIGTTPQVATTGWRAGLERWALDFLDLLVAHPWVLRVDVVRLPMGPNRAAWLDRGLQALAETQLSEPEKMALVLTLNSYVFGEGQLQLQVRAAEQDGRDPGVGLLALLDEPGFGDRLPALRRALEQERLAPPGADADEEDHFGWGLERLLDGFGVLIDRRARAAAEQRVAGIVERRAPRAPG